MEQEQNPKSIHEEQEEMSTSGSHHPSMKFLPVILAVIITAVIVGGGMYWWQASQVPQSTTKDETEMVAGTSTEPETKSIISETQEGDYAVAIEQEPLGESVVTVRDTYNEGAGFSLHFPSSWGLVSVKKRNLTDSGGDNPPQRASYTFTSEFNSHFFDVIISYAKEKENSLVTQQDRIYIAEDDTYYYNYNPMTRFCVEDGTCKEDVVEEINAEIQEIIDSFKLL